MHTFTSSQRFLWDWSPGFQHAPFTHFLDKWATVVSISFYRQPRACFSPLAYPYTWIDTNRDVYLLHTPVHRRAHLQVKCGPIPHTYNYGGGVPWTSPYWMFSVPTATLFGLANLQQKVYNLRQCVSSERFQHVHNVHRLRMWQTWFFYSALWGMLRQRSLGCEHFGEGAWRENCC